MKCVHCSGDQRVTRGIFYQGGYNWFRLKWVRNYVHHSVRLSHLFKIGNKEDGRGPGCIARME